MKKLIYNLFLIAFSFTIKAQKLVPYTECVIVEGRLNIVDAYYDYSTKTKYIKVNGVNKKFDDVYPPDGKDYAIAADWFINDEKIVVEGKYYEKDPFPKEMNVTEIMSFSRYKGVSVFISVNTTGTPDIIYIPVTTGCEFQSYHLTTPECGEITIKSSKKELKAGENVILSVEVKGMKEGMSYMWETNGTKLSGGESEKVTISTKGVEKWLKAKVWVDNLDEGCESLKYISIPVK